MDYKEAKKLITIIADDIEKHELQLYTSYGTDNQDEYLYTKALDTLGDDLYRVKIYADRDRYFSREKYRDCISLVLSMSYKDYDIYTSVIAKRSYSPERYYDTNTLRVDETEFLINLSISSYEREEILFKDWDLYQSYNYGADEKDFFNNLEVYFDRQRIIDEGFIHVCNTLYFVEKFLYEVKK